MEGDEPRALEVVLTSLQIPERKSQVFFSLALRLERGSTVEMVARFSDRQSGQELLSSGPFLTNFGVALFISN